MTTEAAIDNLATTSKHELPGDLAVWFLILLEVSTFALMFLGFSWIRGQDKELFRAGQALLHPMAGLINTLALLAASGLIAQAVAENRRDRQKQASFFMFASIAPASVYVAVKCWEYWQLASKGYSLDGDHFFILYYLTTGFHLLHVLLGTLFLVVMGRKLKQMKYGPDNAWALESGACYWHMVDLVWILLFPIVYVIH